MGDETFCDDSQHQHDQIRTGRISHILSTSGSPVRQLPGSLRGFPRWRLSPTIAALGLAIGDCCAMLRSSGSAMLIVVVHCTRMLLLLSFCNKNGLGFAPSRKAECDARVYGRGRNVPGSRQQVLFRSTKDDASTTKSGESSIELAVQSLASTTLALLSGDAEAAASLVGGAKRKKSIVQDVFSSYDVCGSGTLSPEEAKNLFSDLSRSMVVELSKGPRSEEDHIDSEEMKASQAHANRVLADDEAGNTIERVASKLLLMADKNRDGRINLEELANLFEEVFDANIAKDNESKPNELFPQPLRALAGSLQLLPPAERSLSVEAASKSELYNVGVAGDDHTLRRVMLEGTEKCSNSLSLVGLGRSADAVSVLGCSVCLAHCTDSSSDLTHDRNHPVGILSS